MPDETALEMPDLFKTWEEALDAGTTLTENSIINDGGTLYRVVAPGGVLPQAHQPPHGEGDVYKRQEITKKTAQFIPEVRVQSVQWTHGGEGVFYPKVVITSA